jgi:hypothetical protein
VRAGFVRRGVADAAHELRFVGRRVVRQLYPADVPLPRERAKAPYSAAEIGGVVTVRGARPRAVPTLACYHAPLLAAAVEPGRR